MKSNIALWVAGALLLSPTLAVAQEDEDCPPGGWFCEEPDPEAEPEPEPTVEEPEGESETPAEAPTATKKTTKRIVVVEETTEKPPPPKKRRRAAREWGFNLRLQGVMMGDEDDKHPRAGMGGLGFSLRYRPDPHFAFDVGVDFLGGVDYQGYDRTETALLLSGIVFINPKDKVQVYGIGGLGFSGAEVTQVTQQEQADGRVSENENQVEYSYFGGHLGAGLEFRVARKTALNLDVIGFVRGRTDDKARYEPEFTDQETGRTTNTSGGGLFRAGITFYW